MPLTRAEMPPVSGHVRTSRQSGQAERSSLPICSGEADAGGVTA
jgi:hypothetical protein